MIKLFVIGSWNDHAILNLLCLSILTDLCKENLSNAPEILLKAKYGVSKK